jgi:hypothetical protein
MLPLHCVYSIITVYSLFPLTRGYLGPFWIFATGLSRSGRRYNIFEIHTSEELKDT